MSNCIGVPGGDFEPLGEMLYAGDPLLERLRDLGDGWPLMALGLWLFISFRMAALISLFVIVTNSTGSKYAISSCRMLTHAALTSFVMYSETSM